MDSIVNASVDQISPDSSPKPAKTDEMTKSEGENKDEMESQLASQLAECHIEDEGKDIQTSPPLSPSSDSFNSGSSKFCSETSSTERPKVEEIVHMPVLPLSKDGMIIDLDYKSINGEKKKEMNGKPEQQWKTEDKSVMCWNCGSRAHGSVASCPQSLGQKCIHCGRRRHMSLYCPLKPSDKEKLSVFNVHMLDIDF